MCTYYHIGDHLVPDLVLRCVFITTFVDHFVQSLVLRCVLISTLVTIWYKPSC